MPITKDVETLISRPMKSYGDTALTHEDMPRYEQVFLRDIWDARDLPSVRRTPGCTHRTLRFECVPLVFRSVVKRYCRFLLTEISWGTTQHMKRVVAEFCTFAQINTSNKSSFAEMTRADMEAFIVYLTNRPRRRYNARQNDEPLTKTTIWTNLLFVGKFLTYLQQIDADIAPRANMGKLLWIGDGGVRHGKQSENPMTADKFIPTDVIAQLEANLDKLPERYFPIIALLRASGWRISDILNLKWDTALEASQSTTNPNDQWYWLVGDINKVGIKKHRVPIDKEIADVISEQARTIKLLYTEELNPKRWLFPSPHETRLGTPIPSSSVCVALNTFAMQCGIRDHNGEIYHFRNHAFRHTKAVELINRKMPLVHVQKWLAHASPEMTLRYAKVLDTTLRDEYVKTLEEGAVVLRDGVATRLTAEEVVTDSRLDWERIQQNLDAVALPNGYCLKPLRFDCKGVLMTCHSCSHFCTTPAHLPHFIEHRDRIKEIIARGEAEGRTRWVGLNQQSLIPIENLITVLESGNVHHLSGKKIREETDDGKPYT